MFDSEAAIHHERNAGRCGALLRGSIFDTLLQPNQLWRRAQRERLVHDRPRVLAAPKHIHDVDRVIARRSRQRRVALLS